MCVYDCILQGLFNDLFQKGSKWKNEALHMKNLGWNARFSGRNTKPSTPASSITEITTGTRPERQQDEPLHCDTIDTHA